MTRSVGTFCELTILYEKDFGVFLGDPGDEKGVLLPKKQVPAGAKAGDNVRVFLYKDSEDRIIATTRTPLVTLEQPAVLTVRECTHIGAFLDWGLDKDLFMPFREQEGQVRRGDHVLVRIYTDKSERLCASMKVSSALTAAGDLFKVGDLVTGTVYGVNPKVGAFIAVNDRYFGLLPAQNMNAAYRPGDTFTGRVVRVRPDGKLDLGAERPAYLQMEEDAKKVCAVIEDFGGELPFGEKASPEVIKKEFQLSKAAFKRAISYLLKNGKVELSENSIRLLPDSDATTGPKA